jgi:SagB-type dehydrogenase family enzyme
MNLPEPAVSGMNSVERAIKGRRTVRAFGSQPLTMEQWSQMLWAAQGITEDKGFKRASPSAGALYPMDLYGVVGTHSVTEMEAGVYHYEPRGHELSVVRGGDRRDELARAALSQMWMAKASVNLVITAEYERVTRKYGKRGIRYAMIEAGHIGQNVFLQAEALGLRAGIVGAFVDQEVTKALGVPDSHEPLLIMPVGHPR